MSREQVFITFGLIHRMTQSEGTTMIVAIDELQSQGINASDIQKLRAAGICSVTVSIFK